MVYNGEIFGGSYSYSNIDSDTPLFAEIVLSAIKCSLTSAEVTSTPFLKAKAACSHLAVVMGPYSFIFYHKDSNTILFGRDPFGRIWS